VRGGADAAGTAALSLSLSLCLRPQAHAVLSDPLSRALYDLQIGLVADNEESHARIARLKRKDAQRAVALMEETVAQSRAQEEAKGGLLIVAARYGNLAASEEEAAVAVTPPYIDVAVPLQYLVSDSALVFDAGRSRCWLEGFYDPTMGAATHTNRLYVREKILAMEGGGWPRGTASMH